MSMKHIKTWVVWVVVIPAICFVLPQEPRKGPFLIEGLTFDGKQIVFGCAGRLWQVPREGGIAQALTDGKAGDRLPVFSPDGNQIAFYRSRPGGGDVFLLNKTDSSERRMTYHPDNDWPVCWTPDGGHLILSSSRDAKGYRLYRIGKDGVFPEDLRLPSGYGGAFAPDGRLTYLPVSSLPEFREFRFYRGGMTSPLWATELESGRTEVLIDDEANVRAPIWLNGVLYYLSDRDGAFNLYRRDADGADRKLTRFTSFGIRTVSGSGETLVFVRDGSFYEYNISGDEVRPIDIKIPLDFSHVRTKVVNGADTIETISLVLGKPEACVAARGDVFRVSTTDGSAVNLTRTPGIAERSAAVSPDGTRLAYFSDASGEYQLHIRDLGSNELTTQEIESRPTFYLDPVWSSDSQKLVFTGKRHGLWLFDSEQKTLARIAQSNDSGQSDYHAAWSPDDRYLAFEKRNASRMPSIFVYDVETGKSHPITDGRVYARAPVFDAGGRYLYFLSSPNAIASDIHWSVLSAYLSGPLVIRRLNAVILRADDPPPMNNAGRQPNLDIDWDVSKGETIIDFEEIERRIVPVELESRAAEDLLAGPPGVLYVLTGEWPAAPGPGAERRNTLYRFNFRNPRAFEEVVHDLDRVSGDGDRVLYRNREDWYILTHIAGKQKHTHLQLSALPVPVETREEWAQIFREAWRLTRDYFYDPGFHGNNISLRPPSEKDLPVTYQERGEALNRHFASYLRNITSRDQLNLLLRRMLGHLSVSHLAVSGGDFRQRDDEERVGFLGADYELVGNRYRIKRIYRTGSFDERGDNLRAPLDRPGARVAEGSYLLAVNDKPVTGEHNLYSFFQNTADRPIRIRVSTGPDGKNAWTLPVTPLTDETAIRVADRAERRRRMVEKLGQGRLAYTHVAGYNAKGVLDFWRGYYGSMEREGMIIDQRFNGGGITADTLVEMLLREPLYYYLFREGADISMPLNPSPGPKVLLINEWNGSAAETFALMFTLGKVGDIVGKRTFGAGIGPYGYQPNLIDGGRIQIPNRGAFDPAGNWGIENQGVAPDFEVGIMPEDFRAGNDPQLERAIRLALKRIREREATQSKHPTFPIYP